MPKIDAAKQPEYFGSDDVALLEAVMGLIPDLDIVAYATKLCRARLKYPIANPAQLNALFDGGKVARFKDRTLTFNDALRFLPKEFFPIESEHDFILRIWLAFQRGRNAHALDEAAHARTSVATQDKHTFLPTPAPYA